MPLSYINKQGFADKVISEYSSNKYYVVDFCQIFCINRNLRKICFSK